MLVRASNVWAFIFISHHWLITLCLGINILLFLNKRLLKFERETERERWISMVVHIESCTILKCYEGLAGQWLFRWSPGECLWVSLCCLLLARHTRTKVFNMLATTRLTFGSRTATCDLDNSKYASFWCTKLQKSFINGSQTELIHEHTAHGCVAKWERGSTVLPSNPCFSTNKSITVTTSTPLLKWFIVTHSGQKDIIVYCMILWWWKECKWISRARASCAAEEDRCFSSVK